MIPQILEYRQAPSPIRVWSAGCATGEEAYTAAMLLAEALGLDQFAARVKIYATDIDEDALGVARSATYAAKQLENVPDDLRERYFHEAGDAYSFRNDIQRFVIFGRNDLLQDPPISRVDLLISRNTLMYFEAEAQERVLANFAFALHRPGFLVAGKAEALQSRTTLFEPYDLKHRIFVKNQSADGDLRMARPMPRAETLRAQADALTDSAFEYGAHPQLIVDVAGNLVSANHAARALFRLHQQDVGRPLQDLELSYRPVELRSLIERVLVERRSVSVKEVPWPSVGGEPRTLDVQLGPLVDAGGVVVGVQVAFADVTRFQALHDDLDRARRDLETAHEELQSTVEELETTNEELQSTNEELETTNEELQSTNEELETMNEELQSTNEELEAMNDELRERTDEALHANSFLNSILSSLDRVVVVLDRQLRVVEWSRAAADVWGLRSDEVVGDHFLNLDFGLTVGDLREPIRNVLAGKEQPPLRLAARNRVGHPVACGIAFAPLRTHRAEVDGVILLMSVSPDGENAPG